LRGFPRKFGIKNPRGGDLSTLPRINFLNDAGNDSAESDF
jgi:hypothetical protein